MTCLVKVGTGQEKHTQVSNAAKKILILGKTYTQLNYVTVPNQNSFGDLVGSMGMQPRPVSNGEPVNVSPGRSYHCALSTGWAILKGFATSTKMGTILKNLLP